MIKNEGIVSLNQTVVKLSDITNFSIKFNLVHVPDKYMINGKREYC